MAGFADQNCKDIPSEKLVRNITEASCQIQTLTEGFTTKSGYAAKGLSNGCSLNQGSWLALSCTRENSVRSLKLNLKNSISKISDITADSSTC